MFLRCALLASAVAVAAAVLAPASADTAAAARCEEATLRIYFAHGDAALSPAAEQALRAAERGVADCPYAEMRVLVDAGAPRAHERGQAILNAADSRRWDVARIERRAPLQRVSAGPDFAEVLMSPNALPVGEALPAEARVGV